MCPYLLQTKFERIVCKQGLDQPAQSKGYKVNFGPERRYAIDTKSTEDNQNFFTYIFNSIFSKSDCKNTCNHYWQSTVGHTQTKTRVVARAGRSIFYIVEQLTSRAKTTLVLLCVYFTFERNVVSLRKYHQSCVLENQNFSPLVGH